MALKIKTEPIAEPLSLFEVKDHLRLDHDEHTEDDLLKTTIIPAARRYAEYVLAWRSFITQTWELWLDAWPDKNYIKLPMPPVQEPVVTAGDFVTGMVYRILTVGATNFIAIGAASNTIGVIFTATGAGSGTGTATASGIIKYYGTDDTEYFLDGSYYAIDKEDQYAPKVYLKYGQSWPGITLRPYNGICVTFVAGYGDSGYDVPQNFRQGLLLLIGHFYEHREEVITGTIVAEVPMAAKALICAEKAY